MRTGAHPRSAPSFPSDLRRTSCMIQLVFTDVDGTLVGSSGTVLPAIWTAAERVRAAGIRMAVCSGRPAFGDARGYATRLEPEGWHVFQNGASVVHLVDGRSLSTPLPPPSFAALIARARATGRILELYTDSEYAVESTAPRAKEHARLLGVPLRRARSNRSRVRSFAPSGWSPSPTRRRPSPMTPAISSDRRQRRRSCPIPRSST